MSTIRVTNIQAIGAANPALVISGDAVQFNSGIVIESGITIGTDVGASGQFIMSQGPDMPVIYSTPTVNLDADVEVSTLTATGAGVTFVSGFDLVAATTGDFLEITAFEENNGFIRTFSGDFHDLVIGSPDIFGAFTDSPALQVIGSGIFHSGVFFTDDTDTNAMAIYGPSSNTNSPNIVIGRPGVLEGAATRNSIAIGDNAQQNASSDSDRNIAIGNNALQDMTDGHQNVVIGHAAAQNIRPGNNQGANTVIGDNALFGNGASNNSCRANVVVGRAAMFDALQARNNVAIGTQAGFNLVTVTGNVLIGESVNLNGTTGDNNVFIGNQAAQNNNASGNTAVGFRAGNGVTTGTSFTALGANAGRNVTIGINDTAIGASALQNCISGDHNTAIGTNALESVVSGVRNIGIGFNAGNNLVGTRNIMIGAGAGNTIVNGDNNTIIGALDGTNGLNNTVIIGAGQNERLRITETQLQYPSAGTTTVTFTSGGRGEFEDGVEASDGSSLRLENSAEDQVIAINASGATAGYTLEMPRSAPSANDQVLTVSGGGGSTNVQLEWADAGGGIPAGTVMLFFQASAPAGWTQVTTQNNKALRVVSGTGGGTGGDKSFTTIFGETATIDLTGSVGDTTLTIDQIPAHNHTINGHQGGSTGSNSPGSSATSNAAYSSTTAIANTGGGNSHTHSLTDASVTVDMDLEFIDILLASKD